MNKDEAQAIASHASFYELPKELLMAIIKVESAINKFAYRVEPPYRYLVNVASKQPFRRLTPAENKSEVAPKDFPYIRGLSSRNTEWLGQQASWGPMQIMGAVAREYGFTQAFPELCSYVAGTKFPCLHLVNLKKRFLEKHGWAGVVAAYNAGSPRYIDGGDFENQVYVDKIREHGGFDFMEDNQHG